MQHKSVHEQLLEAERADREARTARWREARHREMQASLREIGRKLCEENTDHPALDLIFQAIEMLGDNR